MPFKETLLCSRNRARPSMRPASGATNAKAGPIRNRHGMAVCASGTARPVPTPSVSTRSTAAATKNDARPYTRISYSPRVPQGTDRRGLPHLQQVGRFWNARLQILPSYGRFAPAGPPPHGHRPGRCACTGPWIRRTCRTMDRHPFQVRKVANGTSAPESDTANTSCRPSYCS